MDLMNKKQQLDIKSTRRTPLKTAPLRSRCVQKKETHDSKPDRVAFKTEMRHRCHMEVPLLRGRES